MISLNKLTAARMCGADRIVIPTAVLEEKMESVSYDDVVNLMAMRLFPFSRCMIEYDDGGTKTYFEALPEENAVAVIRDVQVNNVIFSAVTDLDKMHFEMNADGNIEIGAGEGLRVAAFKNNKRMPLTTEYASDVRYTMAIETISVMCIFAYINKVCLAEPEIEKKAVKNHVKKKQKGGGTVKYISTRKYVLTGCERKSRKGAPKIYTRATWQTRGHWRTYKNGRKVWIKPHFNKRDKTKLTGKRIDDRVYKVGE